MFPEKKVPYSDVRFKPQTLRSARDVMINEAKADNATAKVQTYFSITLHSGEEKTHATEQEFFADYRADKFLLAYSSWRIGGRELVISVHRNVVNIKVCAPDWARIESIFSIFEEAKSDATIYSTPPTGKGVDSTKTLELPTFSLRKRLPSCAVDRPLFERLERYLRNDIPLVASIPDEGRRLTLNLAITDPLGTDKRTTIDTYPLTKFPDGTEQVDLRSTVSGANDEHLAIRLCFHKDRDYCLVSIDSKVL